MGLGINQTISWQGGPGISPTTIFPLYPPNNTTSYPPLNNTASAPVLGKLTLNFPKATTSGLLYTISVVNTNGPSTNMTTTTTTYVHTSGGIYTLTNYVYEQNGFQSHPNQTALYNPTTATTSQLPTLYSPSGNIYLPGGLVSPSQRIPPTVKPPTPLPLSTTTVNTIQYVLPLQKGLNVINLNVPTTSTGPVTYTSFTISA